MANGSNEPTAQQPALTAGTTELLPANRVSDEAEVVYVKEPTHWFRRILVFIGAVGLLVALFFGLVLFKIIPEFHNPFRTETTDRTGPVLLVSIQDMSKYVAAEGNFQVLVDLQENNPYVPNFIFNKRTLFVGVGSVQAFVDFSKIKDSDIVISNNGKDVTITLPPPQLGTPALDTAKSYVFDQDKGVVNHIGDLFSSNPNDSQQLYQLAQQKIAEAATQSELIARAKTNTRLMLESLLHQLGFERVTVKYSDEGASTP